VGMSMPACGSSKNAAIAVPVRQLIPQPMGGSVENDHCGPQALGKSGRRQDEMGPD
jgi:hypothetical protein